MKKIVCEVCGNVDFAKKDNMFICQTCGMAYGAADVKNLLTEVDDAAEATPSPAPVKGKKTTATRETAKTEESLSPTPANVIEGQVTVASQGATVSGEDNLKLQYDLYCWYTFYEKCHELEKSEPFPDKGLARCDDIASDKYPGSIVERTVSFDKNGNYNAAVLPEVKKHYLKEHPECERHFKEVAEEYEKRERSLLMKNQKILENKEKATKPMRTAVIALTVIFGLAAFFGVFAGIYWVSELVILSLLAGAFGAAVVGAIIKGIGGSIVSNKERSFKTEQLGEKKPEKDNWLNENVFNSPDFISYEKEKRAKYNTLIDKDISTIENARRELSDIHNEMKEVVPLPDRYRDEYHVKCLLALVTDRRADTLKEAINLLETENYRSNVLGSLQQLNSHLLALGNSIASLGNMVYQGFSGVMKQNAIINSRITSLQYQQQAMFTAAMLFR